mgnify:CR=1 FL=1
MREFWNPYYEGKQCVCCKHNIEHIVTLLTDKNLVWDNDFDQVRQPLANLFQAIDYYVSKAGKAAIQPELDKLIAALTPDEDDFTIESPIVEYREQKGL